MAIEVPVRKEIADYQSRPVFGLTVRQLVCFGVALPLGAGVYFLSNHFLDSNTASTLTVLATLPIFAFGLFRKNGYTLEKYIKIVWEHRFTDSKTLYKTENPVYSYMADAEMQEDLTPRMLAAKGLVSTAQQETTITYHSMEKAEKQAAALAKSECREQGKAYRKLCRFLAKQERKARAEEKRTARMAAKKGGAGRWHSKSQNKKKEQTVYKKN